MTTDELDVLVETMSNDRPKSFEDCKASAQALAALREERDGFERRWHTAVSSRLEWQEAAEKMERSRKDWEHFSNQWEARALAAETALVEEREACAQMVDDMAAKQQATNEKYPDHAKAYNNWRLVIFTYQAVASAIRARGGVGVNSLLHRTTQQPGDDEAYQ